jgi:streptogramin lyase
MLRTGVTLMTCAFLVAGCADDGRQIRAAPQSAPTSAETPPPADSPELVPAVLPTAIPVTASPRPVADRVLARLELSHGADWMAAGAGAVWVRTEANEVFRIDPATTKVAAKIRISADDRESGCNGIGADDSAVWSCGPDGSVVRIDPATNTVAATVQVGKLDDQGSIPVAFGHAWVLTGDGSTLVGLAHDAPDVTVQLGARCINVTATATSLWASCLPDDQVLRINPASQQVTTRVTGLDTARLISASGRTVWATFLGGLAQIDEATGAVRTVSGVYVGPQAGLFADADGIWVRDEGLFLTRVDNTGRVVDEFSVKEQSGGSVLVAFGSLWATAYNDSVLYRLRL